MIKMIKNEAELLGGWKVRGPNEDGDISHVDRLGGKQVGVFEDKKFQTLGDVSQYTFHDRHDQEWWQQSTKKVADHQEQLLDLIKSKSLMNKWPDEICLTTSGISKIGFPFSVATNQTYRDNHRCEHNSQIIDSLVELFDEKSKSVVHDIFRVIHIDNQSVILSSMRSWLDDWYLELVFRNHIMNATDTSIFDPTNIRKLFRHGGDHFTRSNIGLREVNDAIRDGDFDYRIFQDLGLDLTEAGALFVIRLDEIKKSDDVNIGDLIFLHSDERSLIKVDNSNLPIIKAIHGENGVYDIVYLGNGPTLMWTCFEDHNFRSKMSDKMTDIRLGCQEHFKLAEKVCELSFNMTIKSNTVKSAWVETWRDNRDPIVFDFTPPKAIYTGVIRCPECNGRLELKIPADHKRDPILCGHCRKASINIKSLGIGEKVQTIFPPRTVRTNLFHKGDY